MTAERAADLALALAAALAAGAAVLRGFGGPHEVRHKSPDQPLTAADLEANRILREWLEGERPGYGWLSEETTDGPDRLERHRVWIVDPIDGTRSYIAGRPEFAVSVGLAEAGTAVVGVVVNPAAGEAYAAVRGGGAWAAPLAAAAGASPGSPGWRRLRVTEREGADAVLLASRSELRAGELDPFRGWTLRPTGSTAYKLALVAAGVGDGFLSRGPKSEWDVIAGALLVEEAGGRVTDARGRALRYNRPHPEREGILATNGRLHDRMLELVRELPAPARGHAAGEDTER